MPLGFNRVLLLLEKIVKFMNLNGMAFVEANVELNSKHLKTPELLCTKYI